MREPPPLKEPATSRWSTRAALFALALIGVAAVLHRFVGLEAPVAANLVTVGLFSAFLAFLLALAASIPIWRSGAPGTARVVVGGGLGLMMLSAPLLVAAYASQFPAINDVTTDPASPPEFTLGAKERSIGSNPVAYPGARAASLQADAYPDIKPIMISRSAEEAFELVVEALRRMKIKPSRQDAPGATAAEPGYIEAVDRSLVLGLADDISIRVVGDETQARVDMRSASRFGTSDFGSNAERLRTLAGEIQNRVDATMPIPGEERASKKEKISSGGKTAIKSRGPVAGNKTAINEVHDVRLH